MAGHKGLRVSETIPKSDTTESTQSTSDNKVKKEQGVLLTSEKEDIGAVGVRKSVSISGTESKKERPVKVTSTNRESLDASSPGNVCIGDSSVTTTHDLTDQPAKSVSDNEDVGEHPVIPKGDSEPNKKYPIVSTSKNGEPLDATTPGNVSNAECPAPPTGNGEKEKDLITKLALDNVNLQDHPAAPVSGDESSSNCPSITTSDNTGTLDAMTLGNVSNTGHPSTSDTENKIECPIKSTSDNKKNVEHPDVSVQSSDDKWDVLALSTCYNEDNDSTQMTSVPKDECDESSAVSKVTNGTKKDDVSMSTPDKDIDLSVSKSEDVKEERTVATPEPEDECDESYSVISKVTDYKKDDMSMSTSDKDDLSVSKSDNMKEEPTISTPNLECIEEHNEQNVKEPPVLPRSDNDNNAVSICDNDYSREPSLAPIPDEAHAKEERSISVCGGDISRAVRAASTHEDNIRNKGIKEQKSVSLIYLGSLRDHSAISTFEKSKRDPLAATLFDKYIKQNWTAFTSDIKNKKDQSASKPILENESQKEHALTSTLNIEDDGDRQVPSESDNESIEENLTVLKPDITYNRKQQTKSTNMIEYNNEPMADSANESFEKCPVVPTPNPDEGLTVHTEPEVAWNQDREDTGEHLTCSTEQPSESVNGTKSTGDHSTVSTLPKRSKRDPLAVTLFDKYIKNVLNASKSEIKNKRDQSAILTRDNENSKENSCTSTPDLEDDNESIEEKPTVLKPDITYNRQQQAKSENTIEYNNEPMGDSQSDNESSEDYPVVPTPNPDDGQIGNTEPQVTSNQGNENNGECLAASISDIECKTEPSTVAKPEKELGMHNTEHSAVSMQLWYNISGNVSATTENSHNRQFETASMPDIMDDTTFSISDDEYIKEHLAHSTHDDETTERNMIQTPTETDGQNKNCGQSKDIDLMHVCQHCLNSFSTSEELMSHSCTGTQLRRSNRKTKFNRSTVLETQEKFKAHLKKRQKGKKGKWKSGKNMYTCVFCSKSFSNKKALREHLASHIKKKKSPCIKPGQEPKDNEKKYACLNKFCSETFYSQNAFLTHTRMHSTSEKTDENKRPSCKYCFKQFSSMHALVRHTAIHRRNVKTSFVDKQDSGNDQTTSEGIKKIWEFFSKSVFNKRALPSHASNDNENKNRDQQPNDSDNGKQECQLCSKSFPSKLALYAHTAVHTKKYLYHCGQCYQGFNRKDELAAHESKNHVHLFTCKTCNKIFFVEENLRKHEEKCGKAMGCRYCEAKFTHESELVEHEGKHFDKDFFACVCKKVFIAEKFLLKHQNKCKKLAQKDKIPKSEQKEKGLKPAPKPSVDCGFCNRSFVSQSKLKEHEKLKHHVCVYCLKEYVTEETLQKHQKLCSKGPLLQKFPSQF